MKKVMYICGLILFSMYGSIQPSSARKAFFDASKFIYHTQHPELIKLSSESIQRLTRNNINHTHVLSQLSDNLEAMKDYPSKSMLVDAIARGKNYRGFSQSLLDDFPEKEDDEFVKIYGLWLEHCFMQDQQ